VLEFCNRSAIELRAKFPLIYQHDRAEGRRLTRLQGAFAYTTHNEEKETERHEMA